jgi:NTP pyrophosphatase (non-canonical NTP hydrolase)
MTEDSAPYFNTRATVLEDMQREVHEINIEKGWFETNRTFGDGIALLHSELSEALEAYRDHGTKDATEQRPENHGHWCKARGWSGPCPSQECPTPKPEGVGSEYADVLVRLLDACERDGIDLAFEFERKVAYNRTRPHRHGGRAL